MNPVINYAKCQNKINISPCDECAEKAERLHIILVCRNLHFMYICDKTFNKYTKKKRKSLFACVATFVSGRHLQ